MWGGLRRWRVFSLCAIHSMKNEQESSMKKRKEENKYEGFAVVGLSWVRWQSLWSWVPPPQWRWTTFEWGKKNEWKWRKHKKARNCTQRIFFIFCTFLIGFFSCSFSPSSSPDFIFLIFTHLRFPTQIFILRMTELWVESGGEFLLIASRRWMREKNSTIFASIKTRSSPTSYSNPRTRRRNHFIKTIENWMSSSDGGEVKKKKYFDFARI